MKPNICLVLYNENNENSNKKRTHFLGEKMCSVARGHTNTHTKVNTETLSRFQEFFLQPIIKDRSNIYKYMKKSSKGSKAKLSL